MKPVAKYSIAGFFLLLVWGVIFISTIPVQFILDKISIPPQIQVESVSGTIWNGRARLSWKVPQDMRLPVISASRTDLLWQWCPFHGPLTACIQLDNSELQGEIYLSYLPLDRKIMVHNTRLHLDIKDFPVTFYKVPLTLSGVGEFHVHDTVVPVDVLLPQSLSADGSLSNLSSGEIEFGDYTLDASIENDLFTVGFQGVGENFAVKGKFEHEFKRRVYRYFADVKSADQSLLALLKNYASSSRGGQLTFSGAGEL